MLDAAEAVAAAGAGNRESLTAAWHRVRTFSNLKYRFMSAPDDAAAKQEFEAAGGDVSARDDRLSTPKDKAAFEALLRELARAGITRETWLDNLSRGINCIGQAYPTPVSDGTGVYAVTGFGSYHAFDLDGQRRWLASAPGESGEYCKKGRSPIIWRDLLISDLANRVRAFNRATGKLVWSHGGRSPAKSDSDDSDDGPGSHTIVTPDILTVGGKDILWSAGCKAFLLPEGTPLKVVGWKDEGMQTLVKPDERDVAFFCGAGEHCGWTKKGRGVDPRPPAAVRFSLEGSALKATVLWNGINGADWGGNHPWMTYHRGRLYAPGLGYLDALTGKLLAGDPKARRGGACPASQHYVLVASGRIYGFAKGQGNKGQPTPAVLTVSDLDGKVLATSTIPWPEPTAAERELIRSCERQTDWPRFAHGYTMAFGPDCIMLRGCSRLWCFGR